MGSVAVAGVVLVGLARVLPDEQVMADLTAVCLKFSGDGGELWGGVDQIRPDAAFRPVPGDEFVHAEFLARNSCDVPGTLTVYAGRWHVSDEATGTWRADLAGKIGEPTSLTGPARQSDWGVPLGETPVPPGGEVPVTLLLGLPADETIQDFVISPGWAFGLMDTRSVVESTDDRVPMSSLIHLDSPIARTGFG